MALASPLVTPARGDNKNRPFHGEGGCAYARKNMFLDFFTSPAGSAAILSFFIGSFGYVIARMWVQPLLRYRRIKSRVRTLMDETESLKNDATTAGFSEVEIRETAAKLSNCYNNTLPLWYQRILSNRNEAPDDAVAHLMALANIKDGQHAPKRIANVRAALRITNKNKKG